MSSITGKFIVLYTFHKFVGENPSDLLRAQSGNLYGTTLLGGDLNCNGGQGCGTVFKIDPHGKLTTLYTFHGPDWVFPTSGVIQNSYGNLYGNSSHGSTLSKVEKKPVLAHTGSKRTAHSAAYLCNFQPRRLDN